MCMETAALLNAAIPRLESVIIVMPRSELSDFPCIWTYRKQFVERLVKGLSSTDRNKVVVAVLRRPDGSEVHTYVHAKCWFVDDELAVIGSANIDRRGWESDSEVDAFIFEDALPDAGQLTFAQKMRSLLWAEHLNVAANSVEDASAAAKLWRAPPPGAMIATYDPGAGSDFSLYAKFCPTLRVVVDPEGGRAPGEMPVKTADGDAELDPMSLVLGLGIASQLSRPTPNQQLQPIPAKADPDPSAAETAGLEIVPESREALPPVRSPRAAPPITVPRMDESRLKKWIEGALDGAHVIGTVSEVIEIFHGSTAWPAIEFTLSAGAAVAGEAGALALIAAIAAPVGYAAVIATTVLALHEAFSTGTRIQKKKGYCYGIVWEALNMEPVHRTFQPWGGDTAEELLGAWDEGVEHGRGAFRSDVKLHNQVLLRIAYEQLTEGRHGWTRPEGRILNLLWGAGARGRPAGHPFGMDGFSARSGGGIR